MKAICWHGTGDVRVDTVPDPVIADPGDAIVRITSTAICGSDLHLFDGLMPTMQEGDVLGHEPMGVVEEVGKGVTRLKKGDRVVIPFTISCGHCWFCERQLFALCDTSNPNAAMARKAMGQSPAAFFGYSHMLGGFSGGQAEYMRVPYADVGRLYQGRSEALTTQAHWHFRRQGRREGLLSGALRTAARSVASLHGQRRDERGWPS